VAAQLGQCLELCWPFDALGDHSEADSFGERDHAPHEATAAIVLVQVVGERAVDLYLVDG
jgi:hypothetical protein